MKCSLLTLSNYIDDELSADRRAEVDAHMVGCGVCSTGATTLRQERSRIGQLARVRVAPASARLMLEQLGITGAAEAVTAPRAAPPVPLPPADNAPWHAARSSPALPWTPRRPDPTGSTAAPPRPPLPAAASLPAPAHPLTEETAVPSAAADAQPDLPFDGTFTAPQGPAAAPVPVRAEPPRLQLGRPEEVAPQAETSVDSPPSPPPVEADEAIPSAGWEVELPPSVAGAGAAPRWAPEPDTWSAPAADEPVAAPPAPPVVAGMPPQPAPPRRVTSTGPSMMWSRLRDAVAVRMALSRSGDAIDDSVDIVNGSAPRRGLAQPAGYPAAPRQAASGPPAQPAADPVELAGISGAGRQASLQGSNDHMDPIPSAEEIDAPLWTSSDESLAHASWSLDDDREGEPAAAEPSWNAFAASSYMHGADEAAPLAEPAPQRSRPLGRHSRGLARDGQAIGQRLRAAVTAAAAMPATILRGRSPGSKGAHAASAAGESSQRDRKIIAAIGAVAVIFLTALVIGHGSPSPAAGGTAARLSPSAAPAHGSAPAASAQGGAPAVVAPAPSAKPPATTAPTVQTIGAGATGFQVRDLRYGQQPGYMRIVFDMGPVTGNNGASPTATVASSGPTTLLVTFDGTLPAGSVGSPPPGTVISGVTLASTSGGKTVYRITLTHAVTPSELFLTGTSPPLRFVLDLH